MIQTHLLNFVVIRTIPSTNSDYVIWVVKSAGKDTLRVVVKSDELEAKRIVIGDKIIGNLRVEFELKNGTDNKIWNSIKSCILSNVSLIGHIDLADMEQFEDKNQARKYGGEDTAKRYTYWKKNNKQPQEEELVNIEEMFKNEE